MNTKKTACGGNSASRSLIPSMRTTHTVGLVLYISRQQTEQSRISLRKLGTCSLPKALLFLPMPIRDMCDNVEW